MTPLRKKMISIMQLRGLAKSTQKSYLGNLIRISQYFKKSPDLLSKEEITDYFLCLINKKKASVSYINMTLNSLKFFYTSVLKKSWENIDIPYQKKPKKLPVVLNKREIKLILNNIKNLKHKAIIALIYSGGLRCGEACKLNVSDIDEERMLIRISRGKFKKDRYTLLGRKSLSILNEYKEQYKPEKWLFPGQDKNRPYSLRSIQKILDRAVILSGITKDIHVHTLRHSFATHLVENGYNIAVIQKLLGHKSIKTTTIYTHITNVTIEAAESPIDTL